MAKVPVQQSGVSSSPMTPSPLATIEFALDRTIPVPLYYQLAQKLEAAIEQGALKPGDLLGNEVELAGRLGLSRPTVRQAIHSLVEKGLLIRRRGVGTQVASGQVKRPLELTSLYDDLEAAGEQPTTEVLRNELVPALGEVAAALAISEGSEIHYVERIRFARGHPMAILSNYLPQGLVDPDTGRLEATGLYHMLRSGGITLHSARQSVGARRATATEAGRLEEATGAALLTMQRTVYDDTGRVVEYGNHIYRASRYAFDFQLLVRP